MVGLVKLNLIFWLLNDSKNLRESTNSTQEDRTDTINPKGDPKVSATLVEKEGMIIVNLLYRIAQLR